MYEYSGSQPLIPQASNPKVVAKEHLAIQIGMCIRVVNRDQSSLERLATQHVGETLNTVYQFCTCMDKVPVGIKLKRIDSMNRRQRRLRPETTTPQTTVVQQNGGEN